jgi:uncharacterized protein (DUF885 family)
MHCQGMTVEQATRFFMDHCYYEEAPARQEAIRGAYDPGYLHYTLGKLMLLKLRADLNAQAPKEGAGAFKLSVNDLIIKAVAVALRGSSGCTTPPGIGL